MAIHNEKETAPILEKSLETEVETAQEELVVEPDAPTEEFKAETPEEAELLAHLYKKRVLEPASVAKKKELYANPKVVTADGVTHSKTQNDYRREEYEMLVHAVASAPKKILRGHVDGMGTDESNGQLYVTVRLENSRGLFKVMIYLSELMVINIDDYMQYGPVTGLYHLTNELESRIGSSVHFTVYKVDEENAIAYGNRVEAMEIESRNFYRKKMGDGVPKIVNGTIVEAEVVSARKDRVKVYLCGCETTIRAKELSHLALDTVNDEFVVGDYFNVKVDNIKLINYSSNGRTYQLISLDASKRAAEKSPAEMYYDQFYVGQRCRGVIKAALTDANKCVFVRLQDKIDCVCPYPVKGVAARGVECVVEITQKRDEDKHIYGIIRSLS